MSSILSNPTTKFPKSQGERMWLEAQMGVCMTFYLEGRLKQFLDEIEDAWEHDLMLPTDGDAEYFAIMRGRFEDLETRSDCVSVKLFTDLFVDLPFLTRTAMPPPRWTTPEQWQWLTDHIARYLEAKMNRTTTDFFAGLEAEWLLKWPERSVLGLPALASGVQLTDEQETALATALDDRRAQLRVWYRNNTKKARAPGSLAAEKPGKKKGKTSLTDALWTDGRGHRGPQMVEVYQKMYGPRIAQAIQASNMERSADTDQASPESDLAGPSKLSDRRKTLMSTRRAVSQRLLATETEEVKRAVAVERTRQKNKETTATERTPQSTQESIDEMGRVVPHFLDTVRNKTGLIGIALFGGPIPETGGKLGMKLFSSARSASGYTFKDSHPDWNASVADYFAKYLRKCFTREEREAMALVLQSQNDSDLEEEQDAEPNDTQQQALLTGKIFTTSISPPPTASTEPDTLDTSVLPSAHVAMPNDLLSNAFISGQLYSFPPPPLDPSISAFDDLGHEQIVDNQDLGYGNIDLANMTPPGSEWSEEEWAGLLAQMKDHPSNTNDVSTDSTDASPLYSTHPSSLLEALGNSAASFPQRTPTSTDLTHAPSFDRASIGAVTSIRSSSFDRASIGAITSIRAANSTRWYRHNPLVTHMALRAELRVPPIASSFVAAVASSISPTFDQHST
ncbi:hypothetical protein R3P38DRAFT_2804113 [Favolaschia claudopus]|uniref:Uncharacterized protein n=1 Tax=Favolaschia claudopus TaxID=2862362 RepID=A0AAV9ZQK4_9AGAR